MDSKAFSSVYRCYPIGWLYNGLKRNLRGITMNSAYKRKLRRAKMRDKIDNVLVNVMGYSIMALGGVIFASAWYWAIVLIFQLGV